jgi:triacylglycerol esterase/lipase EstA (alpha/beta hydrolase family)
LVEAIREGYSSSGIVMANIIILTIIISLIGFVFQFINLYIHSLPQVPDFLKLASHDFVLAVTLIADVVIFKTIWDLTHNVLYTSSVSEELEALHKMKITGTKIFEVEYLIHACSFSLVLCFSRGKKQFHPCSHLIKDS